MFFYDDYHLTVRGLTQHVKEADIIKEEESQEPGRNNASDVNIETEGQKTGMSYRVTRGRVGRHDIMTLRLMEKGE